MRFILISAGIAAVAWLNIDDFLRRRRMSADKRAAADEETRRELSIW